MSGMEADTKPQGGVTANAESLVDCHKGDILSGGFTFAPHLTRTSARSRIRHHAAMRNGVSSQRERLHPCHGQVPCREFHFLRLYDVVSSSTCSVHSHLPALDQELYDVELLYWEFQRHAQWGVSFIIKGIYTGAMSTLKLYGVEISTF
jgi:hypothetical protein